jgi:hypothetical protein
MALEDIEGAGRYLGSLNRANPETSDDRREDNNHIRGVKNTLLNTFPNVNAEVTATAADLNAAKGGPFLPLAGGTVSGNLVVTGTSTFNGAVTLGDNIADTVIIGGVVHKNATGNWTIPAPSAGVAVTVTAFAGSAAITTYAGPIIVNGGNTTAEFRARSITTKPAFTLWADDPEANTRNWAMVASITSYGDLVFRKSTAIGGNPINAGEDILSLSYTGTVTIATPSSGPALSVNGEVTGAARLGWNGKAGEASRTAPAAATDLATAIALVNDLRLRAIALGIYA